MGLDRLIYNTIRKGNITLANFIDNVPLNFGSSKDVSVEWDGTSLNILPLTDDVGSIRVGNGTKDIDLKIFLGTSAKYALFDVGNVLLQLEDVDLLLGDNDQIRFGDGTGGDVTIYWDATNLTIKPRADDTGAIVVGDGTTDMDVKIFLGTTSDYVEFNVGDSKVNLAFSSASTSPSTSVEPLSMATTMTGIGGVGGRAKFALTTNVALGGWSNALKGIVTYGASGRTTGLGSAICAELVLSAGTSSGTYAAFEAEIVMDTSAVTGTASSFHNMTISGAAKATFDTLGYIFDIQGIADHATGKVFQENTATAATHALRIRINTESYYIMLTDTGA